MAALHEDQFVIRERDGAVTVQDRDLVLLSGRAHDLETVLRFESPSGIVADFDLSGMDDGGDGFCAYGAGPVRLEDIEFDEASVEVRASGVALFADHWAGGRARVCLRLNPVSQSWHGEVEVSEPVRCLLTAPTAFGLSLHFRYPGGSGARTHVIATVRADDTEFEYLPDASIAIHTAAGMQLVRDAARDEWARSLRVEIDSLECEWRTLQRESQSDNVAVRTMHADRHALRHTGRLSRSNEPIAAMPANAMPAQSTPVRQQVTPTTYLPELAATTYLPAREQHVPERGYLVPRDEQVDLIAEHGYLPAIDRTATENAFGRGAYLEPAPAVAAT